MNVAGFDENLRAPRVADPVSGSFDEARGVVGPDDGAATWGGVSIRVRAARLHPLRPLLSSTRIYAMPRRFIFLAAAVVGLGAAKPPARTAAAASSPSVLRGAVLLDTVTVLGSRTRHADPGPITGASVYDREFIAATGAFRLADFLNVLPQNYTGAGSGRGSAPNDFNPEFGVRSESTVPPFDFVLGAAAVPLGQSGVSGANLRGLGSGSTLVLVDGRRLPIAGQGNRSTDTRQGFVDLNAISLGMIERIEVLADGASALYGSDAIGGAINIVLKKDYTGAELALSYRGTFEGGASERRATLSSGFTSKDARLRGSLSLDLYDRSRLNAAQREFSANQDHSAIRTGTDSRGAPIFGKDLRPNWGYPAVVQAVTGTLNGVAGPTGAPAAVALVPEGAGTTPPAAQFIGVSGASALGRRRANTARFLDLVSPQESRSIGGFFEYDLVPTIRAYARVSGGDVRGHFNAQPPVSAASATSGFGTFATLVPAMINGQPNPQNPFGQDVIVGLVHEEFGPQRQTTHTRTRGALGGVAGVVGERWSWDASVNWHRQRSAQRNLTLDLARFTAALRAPDPAQRFNPFVDARAAGSNNAALYPAMTLTAAYDGASELTATQLTAGGPLRELPGGPLQLAAGADYEDTRHRAFTRPASGAATDERAQRRSRAVYGELFVPVFGRANARPLLRRAELQLAARYQHHGQARHSTDPKVGALWAPVNALRLRAAYSTGFRAPSLTEYQTSVTLSSQTVIDPRRTPASTPGVAVRRSSNPAATPETSTNESGGILFSPPFAPGLSLSADYFRITQRDILQQLSLQTLVNNEAIFPERITRATSTGGQPGAIIAVDASPVNFGWVRNESMDVRLDYNVPWRRLGRFRVNLTGTRTLTAIAELQPGVRADLEGDTGAPPRWRWLGYVLWQRGDWTASVFATHLSGFVSNKAGNLLATEGYPSTTTVNVHAGHTFSRGVWRGRGKGVKIGVGMGNVFNEAPPFSDTVFGFNGGLHSALGRSYDVSVSVPF